MQKNQFLSRPLLTAEMTNPVAPLLPKPSSSPATYATNCVCVRSETPMLKPAAVFSSMTNLSLLLGDSNDAIFPSSHDHGWITFSSVEITGKRKLAF